MTLEQLRIFIAVAEREHVTLAARHLNLTQSAVSAAVSALEERYDVALFNRVGRRIELSSAGRVFLEEARAVLASAAAAESTLADIAGLKWGRLKIAASQTVGNYWLPPVLCRYRAAHPGIVVDLTIGNTTTVAEAVRQGSADLGFVEGSIDAPELNIVPVDRDELVIVAHPRSNAGLDKATASSLRTMRWIFREPGSGTRMLFEAALLKHGVDLASLDGVLELPSNEAVLTAVMDGAGTAALSVHVVRASLEAGHLSRIDFPLPARDFLMLAHKQRKASRAHMAFVDLLSTWPGDPAFS